LAHAEAELKRIEEEDRRNPELVSNYQAQIFEYMRSIEVNEIFLVQFPLLIPIN
jgi:hypothetical protein